MAAAATIATAASAIAGRVVRRRRRSSTASSSRTSFWTMRAIVERPSGRAAVPWSVGSGGVPAADSAIAGASLVVSGSGSGSPSEKTIAVSPTRRCSPPCRVTGSVMRLALTNVPLLEPRSLSVEHPVGALLEGGVMAGGLVVVDDEIAVVASPDHEAAAVDLD